MEFVGDCSSVAELVEVLLLSLKGSLRIRPSYYNSRSRPAVASCVGRKIANNCINILRGGVLPHRNRSEPLPASPRLLNMSNRPIIQPLHVGECIQPFALSFEAAGISDHVSSYEEISALSS